MKLRMDYDTVALMLDLPDDMTITGVAESEDGLVFTVDAPDTYPEVGTPVYGMDDEQNVLLITIEEDTSTTP